MQVPLQITFRGMSPSLAIESLIRERSTRMERFNDRIIHCHVIIDVPHRRSRKGKQFAVHLDITTPSRPIAISRDPGLVNTAPEGDGWFVKIKLSNPADLDKLMDEKAYGGFIKTTVRS